ncbi:hypothetical protein AVEN_101263-1 [Araneus ventricosus]|uniref:Uncharacterized protein n=1 Tax=Araneus ventricosus TaxID=182803 RepID=A0A4Y2R1I4_ARAVE|nr:hypothetical protein AVEN_101263-1 [Araneus ventricosus]
MFSLLLLSLFPIDEGIFHPNPSFYQGVRCQGTIFEWTVYEELKDTVDEIAGHYVSLSRSGLLMFWRRDFQKHFETTIAVLDDGVTLRNPTQVSKEWLPLAEARLARFWFHEAKSNAPFQRCFGLGYEIVGLGKNFIRRWYQKLKVTECGIGETFTP